MRALCISLFAALLGNTALAADAPIEPLKQEPKKIVLDDVYVPGTPPPKVVVVIPRSQRAKTDVNSTNDHLNDALRH